MFSTEDLIKIMSEMSKRTVDIDTVTVVCSEKMVELFRNSGIEFDYFVSKLGQIGKKYNINFYLSKYLPSSVACNFWSTQHPEVKTVLWEDKVES